MAESVSFYSLGRTSIFTISREDDDLFGQVSGQRKVRLAAADDGTYSYPATAGQITLAVGDEGQPFDPVLHQNGRDVSAVRIAELSRQESRPMQPCSIPMSAGTSWGRAACSPSPVTVSGFTSRRPDGRNIEVAAYAPMPFPATMMISSSSCAMARER